jgi:uncharacterized membrane protein (DUF485 family)
MSEDQRITKSFDFAADVTKQLIALSTAIISLCVAFTDKIFSSSAAQSHSTVLLIALLLFVASIIFGIITLMALAGHLGRPKQKTSTDAQPLQEEQPENHQPSQQINTQTAQSPIYNGNVRFFSMGQMMLFVAAIIVAMLYVWKASSTPVETPMKIKDTEKYLKVIRVSDYSIENSCVTDTLCVDPKPGH